MVVVCVCVCVWGGGGGGDCNLSEKRQGNKNRKHHVIQAQ